ncbi:hypothetical protein L1987_38676 [Smallanthus sonchifolius]|uniref:Uncharacterized protein n=1 Tax=Smallanthus sonchifolius TaxID=185202 RepID=A0ACB9HL83_9ASTR|nr:hypothetical protein L1987_38676 [Smallanthus sonchifolius]
MSPSSPSERSFHTIIWISVTEDEWQMKMKLGYLKTKPISWRWRCLWHYDIKECGQRTDGGKIGDLGCAKLADNDGNTSSEFFGTPVFMAPEVARDEEQGFVADVWAVGCAVIEMATGCNP